MAQHNDFIDGIGLTETNSLIHLLDSNDNDDNDEAPIIKHSAYQGWGQVQLTKYSSTPSTPNIYQVQVLVKYLFF